MDAVVKLIRESKDPAEAKEGLMSSFSLSDLQAKAILEMRLQRLTGLERQKILDDLAAVMKSILELLNILEHDKVKMQIITDELVAIKEKFGDERRTEIIEADDGEIDIEDMIADEDAVVTYSLSGYIKRQSVDNYRAQRRGGKGIKGMAVVDEDVVSEMFIASTLDTLLVFTNIGKVHWLKVYRIPEAGRTAKGKVIANLLQLQPGEEIASILSVKKFDDAQYVLCITRNGIVKKSPLMEYSRARQGGIIGLTIADGDSMISAKVSDGDKEILLVTKNGMSIRFHESKVRSIGRSGRGVQGIRLRKGDAVVGAEIVEPGNTILTVTDKGYGKRTLLKEYRVQARSGIGVIAIKCNDKIGSVIGIQQAADGDELLAITSGGKIIRMNVDEISIIGRNTQGVRLVRLNENETIVGIAKFVE